MWHEVFIHTINLLGILAFIFVHLDLSCKHDLKTEKMTTKGKKNLDVIKDSQDWRQQYTNHPAFIKWPR